MMYQIWPCFRIGSLEKEGTKETLRAARSISSRELLTMAMVRPLGWFGPGEKRALVGRGLLNAPLPPLAVHGVAG